MRVGVVIPVGPGHRALSERAVASVYRAWAHDRGPFSHLSVQRVEDHAGELGRSRARNLGMAAVRREGADWIFLLDADDCMRLFAFSLVDLSAPATFGGLLLRGVRRAPDIWPLTREMLFEHGALGTLCMGFFVRADLGLEFDETLDAGEDFDFYLRLPGFTKVRPPLVEVGYDQPSAGGPRGYAKLDWQQACWEVIRRHQKEAAAR